MLTDVLPELLVRHAWHQVLHAQVAVRIRREPGVVIATVPFHLSH